jgi:hypothetical protein
MATILTRLSNIVHDFRSKKNKKGSKKNSNAVNPTVPSMSSTLQFPQHQGTQKQSKQQAKLSQNNALPQGQMRNQQQQLPMFEPKPTQIKIQRSVDGMKMKISTFSSNSQYPPLQSLMTQTIKIFQE